MHGHHGIFIYFYVFSSVTSVRYFHWCFVFGKDLTGCAVPPFCLEVARFIGRAVHSVFQVVCLEDGGPVANRRWPTDRDNIAISDDDEGCQEGSYLRAPLREQRCDSPQGPAHLLVPRFGKQANVQSKETVLEYSL